MSFRPCKWQIWVVGSTGRRGPTAEHAGRQVGRRRSVVRYVRSGARMDHELLRAYEPFAAWNMPVFQFHLSECKFLHSITLLYADEFTRRRRGVSCQTNALALALLCSC